jgi:mannitol-1-/sugar-/sorbitol-6-phosphatase
LTAFPPRGISDGRRVLRCRSVLFDLDGTLVDTSAVLESAWAQWAALHAADPLLTRRSLVGAGDAQTVVRRVFPEFSAQQVAESAAVALHLQRGTQGCRPQRGASGVLSMLIANGVPWAVVTGSERAVVPVRLSVAELPVPAVIVGAEDVLSPKPDPSGYLLAAFRLGVPPEQCLVVEDSPNGIMAGVAAGMTVVGVASTYGPEALTEASEVVASLSNLALSITSGTVVVDLEEGGKRCP